LKKIIGITAGLILLTSFAVIGQESKDAKTYNAGFKSLKLVDKSRTYKADTPESNSLHYRPVDLDIWYPSLAIGDTTLTFGDLFRLFEQRANQYQDTDYTGITDELAQFFAHYPEIGGHLRPLVDIGNSWGMGLPPGDDDIAALAPLVDLIHLKDRDFDAKRTVPLGDGGVPWAKELKRLLGGVREREVVASMETHCPQDGRHATAKSVAALRRIADEIGVEIV